MKQLTVLLLALGIGSAVQAENKTDTSLFMKPEGSAYQTEISSKSGDLYLSIGHHGPAVENEWMALRIYFDQKCAIDVYNKARPGLELKEHRWYPDAGEAESWLGRRLLQGGENRRPRRGEAVGWQEGRDAESRLDEDGQGLQKEDSSVMEMISAGVPYKDRKVAILMRVTVKSGSRFADVEAEVLSGGTVQFVTGINYHPGLEILKKEGRIATWGTHPEDVAADKVAVGAALIYQPGDFVKVQEDGSAILLISKSIAKISTKIISACAREPEINTMDQFVRYIDSHGVPAP